jgi:fatty-acyl-CoA synthase
MSLAMTLSHAHGPALPALLDETIGANLRRTVARFADRQALIDAPTGRTWTYAEFIVMWTHARIACQTTVVE